MMRGTLTVMRVVLALGAVAGLTCGEERPAPKGDPAPDPQPRPRPKYAPLPAELVGFSGHLVGTLVSADDTGAVLKIIHARPGGESRAKQPAAFVGRQMRLLFIAFKGKDGQYAPDRQLVGAAQEAAAAKSLVTVRARTDRDEAVIVDAILRGTTWGGKPDPAPGPAPAADPPAGKKEEGKGP